MYLLGGGTETQSSRAVLSCFSLAEQGAGQNIILTFLFSTAGPYGTFYIAAWRKRHNARIGGCYKQ
jgi:hypothetical protein